MNKKINKNDNFLELVPKKTEKYEWEMSEDGLVRIIIPREGLLDKAVRIFFKTPKVMKIDLDSYGSFIWNNIDGSKNIEEIANILSRKFGKDVEPLYDRIGTYINILRNNKFITVEKVSD